MLTLDHKYAYRRNFGVSIYLDICLHSVSVTHTYIYVALFGVYAEIDQFYSEFISASTYTSIAIRLIFFAFQFSFVD